jgi:hypothetical protein
MGVFSLLAGALAQTLVGAHRARRTSGYWLRATELAAEEMERLRAGDRGVDAAPIGPFVRTWNAEAISAYAELERLEVTVAWEDGGPRHFELTAIGRRTP